MESADPVRATRYARENGEIVATMTACAVRGPRSARGQIAKLEHASRLHNRSRTFRGISVQHQMAAAVETMDIPAVLSTDIVVARTTNAVAHCWSVVRVGMWFLLICAIIC
jgi:hypothetical protein